MSFKNKDKSQTTERINTKRAKTPLALHMYLSFALVIVFIFISNSFLLNTVLKSYVVRECNKRIDNAIQSCDAFALAYGSSVNQISDSDDIKEYLLNSIITSTEISNEASMILLSEESTSNEPEILWPSENYSASASFRAHRIVKNVYSTPILEVDDAKELFSVTIDNNVYYYKLVKLTYIDSNDSQSMAKYYLLFYVDTSAYMSFSTAVNAALFRTMIIAIIIAGIMSIITSFPIISSTKKLSDFSNRISKGDFSKFNGNIVSRELCSLSENMNSMADKLNEADKEQKTFFQNASHELRTPLMSIQGYAEGIKYDVFDNEQKDEAINIIIDETNRLSGMVENLLSISKMDLSKSGAYKVKKTSVNVSDLVGLTIDKIRGQFILSDIELINDIKLDDVYVFANENDLFRMLENIFSNCIRYAKTKVTFRCFNDKENVVFVISDDGEGVSDEIMKHLFERFTKGSDGKHGIGLALVKSIVEEHSGTINVSNNNGAVFEIKIPLFSAESTLSQKNMSSDEDLAE